MKKIIIICEGQSEQMFCDKILKVHFAAMGIQIEYPLILHSGGGIVKWKHLKNQIELHYADDNNAFITTFIDYYGIEPHHLFPEWIIAHAQANKALRMDILETGMKNDLSLNVQPMFIANIQLHEFEALVLSDHTVFGNYYEAGEHNNANLAVICSNPPETVNNGILTAPSKRLIANIPSYDKVTDGAELARLIGLAKIRNKCPRFDSWITNMENI